MTPCFFLFHLKCRTDDLRKLLDALGLALHHTVVKELALNVSVRFAVERPSFCGRGGRGESDEVHNLPLFLAFFATLTPVTATAPNARTTPHASAQAR